MEYIVVEHETNHSDELDKKQFESMVQHKLDAGWICQGGAMLLTNQRGHIFYRAQAMVFPSSKSNISHEERIERAGE